LAFTTIAKTAIATGSEDAADSVGQQKLSTPRPRARSSRASRPISAAGIASYRGSLRTISSGRSGIESVNELRL
jgi:hypothetical protein